MTATDTAERTVNRYRITQALDAIDATGPGVDLACGAVEPAVDRWEAGTEQPSRRQVELLAALTGRDPEWFYGGSYEAGGAPRVGYVCSRSSRGCGTVVDGTVVDSPGIRSARRRAERDAEERAAGWDPANDQRAKGNRMVKARAIATWMWHRDLDVLSIATWDQATRRAVARAVGVNPPHGDATWIAVAEGLARWEVVRTEAPREHLDEHAAWCPGCDAIGLHPAASKETAPDLDVHPLHATQLETASDLPAAPNLVDHFPKGWCALTALGPVDPPRACTVLVDGPDPAVVDGVPCGAPAVVRMPTSTGADVWRCAKHPPLAGEWGHGLNHAPSRCVAPLRCFCGRCPLVGRTPSGDTVLDQQAIASGRRRSSPRRYAEARAAVS